MDIGGESSSFSIAYIESQLQLTQTYVDDKYRCWNDLDWLACTEPREGQSLRSESSKVRFELHFARSTRSRLRRISASSKLPSVGQGREKNFQHLSPDWSPWVLT